MKIRLIILSFALILTKNVSGQNQGKIVHIKAVVSQINTDKSLKQIVISNDELADLDPDYHATDGGCELTGYFRRDTLVKVTYWLGVSFGVKTFDYYLEKGKTLFAYEKVRSFPPDKKGDALDHNHLTTTFEGRYYTDNNKVIMKIETPGSHLITPGEAYTTLANDIARYTKLLRKKRSDKVIFIRYIVE